MVDKSHWRHIRSFVRREGRLTKGQQRAIDELGPQFMLGPGSQPLDLDSLFGRQAPHYLEIGFGDGKSLASMAAANPDIDFIGVEVHRPGVGSLLLEVEHNSLTNVRVICADVVEVLKSMLPEHSLDRVMIFFPDPWHKKRHHKRRLVQPDFVAMLRKKLKPDGVIHMATDWEDYAMHMLSVMNSAPGFSNTAKEGSFVMRPEYRPLTKFEARGKRLGHGVWDLIFKCCDNQKTDK